MSRRVVTCASCGRERPHKAHGWCGACHMGWLRAGRPADGPPPPRPHGDKDGRITCRSCGEPDREHIAHGWCAGCYFRWYRAGRPDDGPPPRIHASSAPDEYEYRLGEYAFLISCGEAWESVARRLGVSELTARRYNRALAVAA